MYIPLQETGLKMIRFQWNKPPDHHMRDFTQDISLTRLHSSGQRLNEQSSTAVSNNSYKEACGLFHTALN